jgi:Sec-independent protein translocase protein TatA
MVNKKNAFWIIFILVVVLISLLLIFLPKGGSSTGSMIGATDSKTPKNFATTQQNVTTSQTNSQTNTNTSTQTQSVDQTNTQTTDGIITEPYENEYVKYENCGYVPPGYHRYQSNLCDPTQDELPITMPDPNEGIDPLNADPLWLSIQYGSLPCGKSNKLNYCQ